MTKLMWKFAAFYLHMFFAVVFFFNLLIINCKLSDSIYTFINWGFWMLGTRFGGFPKKPFGQQPKTPINDRNVKVQLVNG